jgi:hypothetical protein
MRKFLFSERSLVVILFIAVIVTFSFAQKDSKKIEEAYMAGLNNGAIKGFYLAQNTAKEKKTDFATYKSPENEK